MAELGKLNLKSDKLGAPIDVADLPQQMGSFNLPLPPGPYVFKTPPHGALKQCFDVIEKTKELDLVDVQRLSFTFKDDAALEVAQAPGENGKELIGRKLRQRITNIKRKRGKKDDPNAKDASDADYLLMSLGEAKLPARGDNAGYGQALLKYPAKLFGADVEYGYQCRDDAPIRVETDGGQTVKMDGTDGNKVQKGCGQRFYQNDVDKVEGKIPTRIQCTCGAILYAQENLGRFRKVSA
jgi:hypothetical protein